MTASIPNVGVRQLLAQDAELDTAALKGRRRSIVPDAT
jgi:hypothetical protein